MNTKIRKSRTKAIIVYNIFFIIAAIAFYYLIPVMLDYPPNCINNEFEKTVDDGMQYFWQYTIIFSAAMIVSNIYFINQLKSVEKYKEYVDKDDPNSMRNLDRIKRKCFLLPYQIYIIHATVPSVAVFVLLLLTGAKMTLTSRIVLLIFAFTLVLGLLAYIFSKDVFSEILIELKNKKKYQGKIKIGFRGRIFVLFLPLFFLMIVFTSITSDTLLSKERGTFLYENYYRQLTNLHVENVSSLSDAEIALKQVEKYNENDKWFIITKDAVMLSEDDTEISEFFRKYAFDVAKDGHTYGYFASDIQGAFKLINIDGTEYAVGMMYGTASSSVYTMLMYTMLLLMFLCAFFLIYFSREISEQVLSVSSNMTKISSEELVDYEQKMPVISNDELGDLTIAFNKILDLQKAHADEIEKNQEMLVERERLSSLGQLIGGMAHNLKTPIMSIAGASQAIRELIEEYNNSIGNPQVTNDDHHDIAKEMKEWNEKIKLYLEYMTEVINATKGQAVSMNASTVNDFTLEELLARVKILMKEQLMRRGCTLNLNVDVNKDTVIKGEISAIVQVLDNLIVNAMDAYGEGNGDIVLRMKEDDKKVYIEVQDFAGGIPENVQKKLFKQMITTKGKDGTGLGLYMCYSTIRGKFNGEMRFETEQQKGTTFFIELNKN